MDANVKAVVRTCTDDSDASRTTFGEVVMKLMAAGCVGYFVSLAGRRAVYYGRTIDCHVEWFPGAR